MTTKRGIVAVDSIPRIGEEIAEGIELVSGAVLIGSWVEGVDGYAPSPTGDYSAVVRDDQVEVVRSIYTVKGAGGGLEFVLPPELMEE